MKSFLFPVLILLSISSFNPGLPDKKGQDMQVNNVFPEWSPAGDSIVFASNRTGNYDIWLMTPDGQESSNLTQHSPDIDIEPHWSPEGDRIAFRSNRSGDSDVWLMNHDGSNPINLTENVAGDVMSFQWSPDAQAIVFDIIAVDPFSSEIWIVDTEDHTPLKLTQNGPNFYRKPSWSPDGQLIVFEAMTGTGLQETNDGIWQINTDGSSLKSLTSVKNAFNPVWSHSGEYIAMHAILEFNFDIVIFRREDGTLINLTNTSFQELTPIWSLDDSYIAFWRSFDLWIITADGTNAINLTANVKGVVGTYGWSPHGDYLVLTAGEDDFTQDIWTVNIDGSHAINLTSGK